MPHRVGKKWKWGNIERSSKEDLRKTVYGIWKKNGGKGSFSSFWKTGKVSESDANEIDNMSFKKISRDDVPSLLDQIETYTDNERFNRAQFEKYLTSNKDIDGEDKSMFYGLFNNDGHCLALSYLNKTPTGCVLVAMVACVIHGYGRVLLDDIISRSDAIWLVADPNTGDSLLEYYRTFGLEEFVLDKSKWADGKPEHFFFKASGKAKDRIMALIQSAAM